MSGWTPWAHDENCRHRADYYAKCSCRRGGGPRESTSAEGASSHDGHASPSDATPDPVDVVANTVTAAYPDGDRAEHAFFGQLAVAALSEHFDLVPKGEHLALHDEAVEMEMQLAALRNGPFPDPLVKRVVEQLRGEGVAVGTLDLRAWEPSYGQYPRYATGGNTERLISERHGDTPLYRFAPWTPSEGADDE